MAENPTPTAVMDRVWALFGEGRRLEIPELLFAEDSVIKVQGAPHVPFVGEFRGRDAQVDFFALGGAEAQKFEVKRYIADGDDVITVGEFDFLVTSTGRHYSGEWLLHTIVREGKIELWQMFEDSWSVGTAFDA